MCVVFCFTVLNHFGLHLQMQGPGSDECDDSGVLHTEQLYLQQTKKQSRVRYFLSLVNPRVCHFTECLNLCVGYRMQ